MADTKDKARYQLTWTNDAASGSQFVDDEREHWLTAQNGLDGSSNPQPEIAEPDPRQHLAIFWPSETQKAPLQILGQTKALASKWLLDAFQVEERFGTPFVLAPVAFGLGVIAYFQLPSEPTLLNIASALLLVLIIFGLVWHRAQYGIARFVTAMLLLMVSGLVAAKIQTIRLATPMLGSAVTSQITGIISGFEKRADGSVRLTIDIIETKRPTLRYAPNRIRVTTRKVDGAKWQDRPIGRIVSGRVRLTPPSGPFRPSGYDFSFFSYFRGIGANGFFLGSATIQGDVKSQKIDIVNDLSNIRYRLAERIMAVANRDVTGGLAIAAALVTGERSRISKDDSEILRTTGLAHILAISGLHMALVSGTVMLAWRAGAAFFPVYASRHPIKKHAAIAALMVATLYLFVSGGSVATQRAWIMLAVMLLAVMTDQAAVTMRNLALAALIVLAIAPNEIMGPSFQMSFAATAALIAVYRTSAGRFASGMVSEQGNLRQSRLFSGLHRVAFFLLALMVTSLIAGAATGIFAAYHFNRVAPFGLLTNLLAMPLVSLVIMPAGLIGVMLVPFGLDGFAFSIMGQGLDLVIAIARWVDTLSPDGTFGQLTNGAMIVLCAGLLIVCICRSRLAFVGIVLLVSGGTLSLQSDKPVALISADAKQFAVVVDQPNGRSLFTNRNRPNRFTMDQWQPAYQAQNIQKPVQLDNDILPEDSIEAGWNTPMVCNVNWCAVSSKQPDGRQLRMLYVLDVLGPGEMSIDRVCARFDLIIHAYAPSKSLCDSPKRQVLELRAQNLALRGSAEIYWHLSGNNSKLRVKHALDGSNRPWHAQRKFSRAARNLPEWKPQQRK